MRVTLRIACWIGLIAGSALIAHNSAAYFSQPRSHGFVIEKGELADQPLWMAALLIHVAAGLLCLASSFLQFFRPLLRRVPRAHRCLGRIYVWSVLGLLVPTGSYLAVFAHGGPAGVFGFLLLGALTAATTWKGWIAMRRSQRREHVRWMVRSFAMVSSAITFRLEFLLLQLLGLSPEPAFLTALYLSIGGNALAAEWLLRKISLRTQKPKPRIYDENEAPSPFPVPVRHP